MAESKTEDQIPKRWRKSYDWQKAHLEKHARSSGISETCLQPIIKVLLPKFAQADTEALRKQFRFRAAAIGVYIMSAIAVTIAIIHYLFVQHEPPHFPSVIILELAVLIAALALIRFSKHYQLHRAWLHARHLAEQLRTVMYVLIISGEKSQSKLNPVQVLSFYDSPDSTLQEAVKEILCDKRLQVCATSDFNSAKRFLIDAWILDQANFHEKNKLKCQRRLHKMHIFSSILFVVTCIAVIIHLIYFDQSSLVKAMVLFAIMLPAWAASMHGITDLLEWERIGQRSKQMAALLREKVSAAEKAETFDQLRVIAQDAEWVMAMENYEWLVSLGFRRPPPVPT